MWSQTYDRELDDIFAVQAEIAREVARMLRVTLLEMDSERIAAPDTQNQMAHDKYLWGLQRARQFSVASLLEAVDYFREATELDPDYAKAHAGVTTALAQAYTTSAIPADALLSEGARHAERAIELDPGLSEAHSGQGAVLMARGQVREAGAAYRLALELNPGNSLAAFLYGNLLLGQHRFEEALAVFEQALERSPVDATLRGATGWAHDFLGNSEEAMASYSRARAIDASNPFGFYGPGLVTAATGELAASAEWFERAAKVDPNDAELFAWAAIMHLSLDDTASATRAAEKAVELNPLNTLPRLRAHSRTYSPERTTERSRWLAAGFYPTWCAATGTRSCSSGSFGTSCSPAIGSRRQSLPTRQPSRRSRPRRRSEASTRSFRKTRWASSPGPPSTSPTSDSWPGTVRGPTA